MNFYIIRCDENAMQRLIELVAVLHDISSLVAVDRLLDYQKSLECSLYSVLTDPKGSHAGESWYKNRKIIAQEKLLTKWPFGD